MIVHQIQNTGQLVQNTIAVRISSELRHMQGYLRKTTTPYYALIKPFPLCPLFSVQVYVEARS